MHVAQLVIVSKEGDRVEQIWHINTQQGDDNHSEEYFKKIQDLFKDPDTGNSVKIGLLRLGNYTSFKIRLEQVDYDIRADPDLRFLQ